MRPGSEFDTIAVDELQLRSRTGYIKRSRDYSSFTSPGLTKREKAETMDALATLRTTSGADPPTLLTDFEYIAVDNNTSSHRNTSARVVDDLLTVIGQDGRGHGGQVTVRTMTSEIEPGNKGTAARMKLCMQ